MNKSKKGGAITPDKPANANLIMKEIEREKAKKKNEEGWAFDRGLQIKRIADIAEIRVHRPNAKYYIRDDDRNAERILEAPLPRNEYVGFDDDSDRANNDLATLCTRLAVRLMTLNAERNRVKSSPWSSDQDTRIRLIDEAKKLIKFVLNAPTTSEHVIEKRLANYGSHSSQEAEWQNVYPPAGSEEFATLLYELINTIKRVPEKREEWERLLIEHFGQERGIRRTPGKGKSLIHDNKTITMSALRKAIGRIKQKI